MLSSLKKDLKENCLRDESSEEENGLLDHMSHIPHPLGQHSAPASKGLCSLIPHPLRWMGCIASLKIKLSRLPVILSECDIAHVV